MALVSLPLLLHVLSELFVKPSDDEIESQKLVVNRRIEVVNEIVASCKDEDFTSDKPGRVRVDELLPRCFELLDLPPSDAQRAALHAAIDKLGPMTDKELRVALNKTQLEKPPPEYADGTKLAGLVHFAEQIDKLLRRSGQRMDAATRKPLWEKVYAARAIGRARARQGILKAGRLIYTARDALKWVLLQSFVSIVVTTVHATSSYYRASVLDSFTEPDDPNTTVDEGWEKFRLAAQAMMYVQMLATLLDMLVKALRERGQRKMGTELKLHFFGALLKKDLVFWTTKKGPWHELIMKVMMIEREVDKFIQVPEGVIKIIVTVATHAALVMQRSSRMLYLMLMLNWGALAVNWAFVWARSRASRWMMNGIMRPNMDDFTWVHALNPQFVSTYQSFVRGETERRSLERYLNATIRLDKAHTLVDSFATPVNMVLAQSTSIAQYGVTGTLVSDGIVGVSQAGALMHSAQDIANDTQAAISTWNDAKDKAAPLAEMWDLCNSKPSIDPDMGITPPGRAKGHIVFERVEFQYPERDAKVLKGTSFEVQPGQTLGMTGSAGCGKSTALRLLERFYDVSAGRITLDGKDIREYAPDWLRGQIATVAQEPKLLPCSIRENIVFGCPKGREPTLEEVHSACKAANIYDELMDKNKFPEGLRTKLTEVSEVSGGQKQRIAIARAILADPPVLLLDEATSALDEENQEKVQAALNTLMKGRTTLVIAHRLSTIRSADKIVAFDDGRVVEGGTHAELLKTEGSIYAKLWRKQAGTGSEAAGGADEHSGGAPAPAAQKGATPAAVSAAVSAEAEGADLEEHHVDQHHMMLSMGTRLGRIERQLSEGLKAGGSSAASSEAIREAIRLVKQLQDEASGIERQKTEQMEEDVAAAAVLGAGSGLPYAIRMHSMPPASRRAGSHDGLRRAIDELRQLRGAGEVSTANRNLLRLGNRVLWDNRQLDSSAHFESEFDHVPPLPRRIKTVA